MEQRIESRKNPYLQQVRKLLSSRSEREKSRLFVCDGTKLLDEAVAHFPGLDTVILSDGVNVQNLPNHVRLIRVSKDIMASVSPMEAPQGAVFVCKMPEETDFVPQRGCLILDGIQDPGNLGTILRTADALEVPVVLLDGCADPYSWKVVRASMGAVFRTGIVRTNWETAKNKLKAARIPIGVTALSPRAIDLRQAKLHEMALVIGSEGQGVRKDVLDSADQELIIPMNSKCESLNAAIAAAIVMWQMKLEG